MNKELEPLYHRMLTEFGGPYVFEGTLTPTHYNTHGLTKSVDWETGILIKNFVEFYKPETVIELGTFRGYSTAWLIMGTLINEFGHVHAYEVFNEGEYGKMWYDEFRLPKDKFTYHYIPGGIWNFPREVPDQIDLIYHDTQHLLSPTIKEMDFLLPRVKRDGFVLIDDMKHPDYGPMQIYLNDLFGKSPDWSWHVLAIGHGLGIARKK